jgi:hypothetical protein
MLSYGVAGSVGPPVQTMPYTSVILNGLQAVKDLARIVTGVEVHIRPALDPSQAQDDAVGERRSDPLSQHFA